MKRKSMLFLIALLAALTLSACKEKPEPGPGPDPETQTEITSNNAAPAGFVDDGPMDWDE
jgi:hypothetical protein